MAQQNIKQIKGATQGSVLFLGTNGVVSENNGQLFWSTSTNGLSIGTSSLFGSEKLRIYGSQRIDGDLIITGSFSVLGSASIINTNNLTVSDPIILLAASQSGSPTLDSGLFIKRGTGATQAFIWDESDTKFSFIQTNSSSTAIGNVTIASGAEVRSLRYNFFDTGAPANAASSYINAPSGGAIGVNATSTIFFNTPQISSSAQNTLWDIGANELTFQGGASTTLRSFRIGVNDSGNNIPTFTLYSQSIGASSVLRTGLSFSHRSNVTQNGVLERGVVIEVRDSGTYSGTAVGLTIDVTGVTNSNRVKRGIRIIDGTQQNGYVLVSDSDGVGTWTASSNIVSSGISVNNGLTYSSGSIGLGGTLSRPTYIQNDNFSFTMSTTNNIEFLKNLGGVTYSHILNNTGSLVRAVTSTGHNLLSADDSSARIEVRDIVSGSSFSNIRIFNYDQTTGDGSDASNNNRMVVRDDYYSKGLIYYQDYSANFTNNSLVTKAYVLSAISTTGSGTTNYGARWVTSTQLGTGSVYDSGTAVGIATQSNGAYALNVYGDVNIMGTLYATSKSFEIVHPLNSSKRLTYGSLEGPEYGVYYRGRLDNENIINLPDYWTGLVDESTISVNITPIGMYQRLFVDRIESNKVYVGSDNSGSPKCYYIVYAERKDIPKIIIEK